MIRQTLIITALTATVVSLEPAAGQYYRNPLQVSRYANQPQSRLPGEKRLWDAINEIPKSEVHVPGYFMNRHRGHSMFLDRRFGVVAGIKRPNDFASYSLQRNNWIDVKSDYLKALVRMPVSQFPSSGTTEPPWTLEEVKTALKERSTTRSVLDSGDWRFPQREERDQDNRKRSDDLRAEGIEIFRMALQDDGDQSRELADQIALFTRAIEKFNTARNLQPEDPANYIALTIVEREKRNLNTALVYLTQGLTRLTSLDELDLRREDFFENDRDWSRRLDEVNALAINTQNEATAYLMLALFAHLNGDRGLAQSSTRSALKLYTQEAEAISISPQLAYELEQRIEQTQKFLDLLEAKDTAPETVAEQE